MLIILNDIKDKHPYMLLEFSEWNWKTDSHANFCGN